MFGIGFGEFTIIFIVLIIAVGPEKLPTLMKTVGRTIRSLRQASRDIRTAVGIDEMMREDFSLHTPPARKPMPPQGQPQGRGQSPTGVDENAAPAPTPQDNAVNAPVQASPAGGAEAGHGAGSPGTSDTSNTSNAAGAPGAAGTAKADDKTGPGDG